MKAFVTLAVVVGGGAVVGGSSSSANARAPCRGVEQLRDLLLPPSGAKNAGGDAIAALLDKCVAPLLFLPNKWAGADGGDGEGAAYCAQCACEKAVERLRELPACTWTQKLPSLAERELVVAQRVMTDCGGL